jgi:hypothetical protein
MTDLDRVLCEDEASKFLGVGRSSMQRWRYIGIGPKFVRVSKRRLGYRLSDLEAYLREREEAGEPAKAEDAA